MSKLLATRGAQWPLYSSFIFNFNDWAIDSVSGVKKTFGAAVTNTGAANAVDPATGEVVPGLTSGTNLVFDAIPMPIGAVICGGEVIVETVFNGTGTDTVSVGIAGATTALAATVDLETAGRTALTLTTTVPMTCNSGQNIRLTFANGGADCTAGKGRVRVFYTIDGKQNENVIN